MISEWRHIFLILLKMRICRKRRHVIIFNKEYFIYTFKRWKMNVSIKLGITRVFFPKMLKNGKVFYKKSFSKAFRDFFFKTRAEAYGRSKNTVCCTYMCTKLEVVTLENGRCLIFWRLKNGHFSCYFLGSLNFHNFVYWFGRFKSFSMLILCILTTILVGPSCLKD